MRLVKLWIVFLMFCNAKICFMPSLPQITFVSWKLGVDDVCHVVSQIKALNKISFKSYILFFKHLKQIKMINTFMLGNTVGWKTFLTSQDCNTQFINYMEERNCTRHSVIDIYKES